jgi:hypothetical protein
LAFLLEGVSGFRLKKECSEIQVHGLLAFPIFPFLVGAYYGRGRVLCVTHEELFGQQVGLKFKMLSHDFKREKVAKDQCTKLINLVDLYLICVSGPLFTLFSRKSRFSFKYNEIVKVKYDTNIYIYKYSQSNTFLHEVSTQCRKLFRHSDPPTGREAGLPA